MSKIYLFVLVLFITNCDSSKIEAPFQPDDTLIKQFKWEVLNSTPGDITSFVKNDDIYFLNEEIGWVIGSGTGTVYKTSDGGNTWVKLLDTDTYFRSIGFLTEEIGYVGALYGDTQGVIVYETRDAGVTWNPVEAIQNSPMQGVCGISIVDENTMVAGGRIGGAAYIAMTTDQGLTWKIINPQSHISMITDSYFWDANNGLVTGGFVANYHDSLSTSETYARSEMRIIRTRDGGDTWEDAYTSNRKAEWGWKFSFVNDQLGFASIQSHRGFSPEYPEYDEEHILKTKDGGESWEEIVISDNFGSYYSTQGIAFMNEYVGWIGSWLRNKPMRYTYDGGQTWYDSDYIGLVNRIRIVSDSVIYAVSHDILKADIRKR